MRGGADGDTLDGGPGADTLDGGAGTDTATYASAMEGVTVDLSGGNRGAGDAAGDNFDSIEQYRGSNHADIFIASDDPDNINGGPDGDTSKDTVSYARSDEGVTVNLDTPAQAAADSGYANGDTLTNIENVIGSNHVDTLTAISTGSVITGGKEDDILHGGSGNDTFVFASGDGEDQINSFAAADKIDLSAFTSIASLDDLKDDISTLGTNNIEIDLPGSDDITLISPAAFDANADFFGLTPDNFIFYTKVISGNMGDRFNNKIDGGRGDDAIYGEQGRDIINGGAGDDEIYGGEDKDTINGGEGDDWLDGGPGIDTFVFEPGSGNDYIMDFTTGDRIDLTAFIEAGFTLDTADKDTNADTYTIELPDDGTITILDFTGTISGTEGVFIGA